MSKTYLTEDELKQFPRLLDLVLDSVGEDTNLWGLCKNENGDVAFGEACEGWKLVVNLNTLLGYAASLYGEDLSAEDIVLFYASEYKNPRKIIFHFIKLSTYIEHRGERDPTEWICTQK